MKTNLHPGLGNAVLAKGRKKRKTFRGSERSRARLIRGPVKFLGAQCTPPPPTKDYKGRPFISTGKKDQAVAVLAALRMNVL